MLLKNRRQIVSNFSLFILFIFIIIVFTYFCSSSEDLNPTAFSEELAAYMDQLVERDGFSGVVLFARDGKPIFKKAYGMADKESNIPNQIDTKFNLASFNKMFTAVAVARLEEQDKLSYDDPIGKYLGPDWIRDDVKNQLKIYHLLTHTSGLEPFFTDRFYNSDLAQYRKLEDYKWLVKDKSLLFQPGTKWSYCNTGFFLLGAIIEKVTGESYYDYVKEHVFKPAGMNNTDFYEKDKPVPNRAIGYNKVLIDGKRVWEDNMSVIPAKGNPSGGGYSTAEDLLKFAQALLANKLISKKSRERLLSGNPELNAHYIGYGFLLEDHEEFGRIAGHGGVNIGISNNFRMLLDRGYTMIILSNYTKASHRVWPRIYSILSTQ